MSWENAVAAVPVIMVIRCDDVDQARSIATSAVEGGATMLEITLTTPGAVGLIAELAAGTPEDVIVGAGTVLTGHQADESVRAGAQFLVAPDFDTAVLTVARDTATGYIPGAYTPTEVLAAVKAGVRDVKIFPATSHQPSYLRAIKAVSPGLRLYPSGGIDASNAGTWLAAGARAVCISSALNQAVSTPDGVRRLVSQLVHDHTTNLLEHP